jgi:putative transcriptional regulator
MAMFRETVSNKVLEFRTKQGLTQEDVAHSVGVTRQTVIAIEKGNYVPSVLLALKIARLFKAPVEDIFKIL